MNQYRYKNLYEIDKNDLLKEGYKYALLYYLNDLYFGDIEDMNEIKKDILVEGFFFNENRELHFFEDNNFQGIITEHSNEEDGFYEEYLLKKRLGNKLERNKYDKIKVFNYISYEDDGQAFVKYTALKGVK
ncbi:hypothetical protein [Terrisporobacter mayombei]|uniref:Uncharacterized protein n=1 Tax=Terrisporobacter mayombei TaxID=1541 RepID=A0ABY9PXS6_9FIRM|nr:hypothetical protein [Terrisporobacter mayombei]MCC3867934.1 hypothetical protein [Terrisporobacter mayombei]WMT80068.1 hypothetical protein TEMA_03450 [Terrisporobacter mayombei]